MAAPFVVKRSWQAQAELHQHWPSLDLTRVCLVVSYPLWHLKTREQVLGSSCLQHGRELIKHLGLRGMYRGGLFGTLALLPGHCLWYMAYEGSKWHLTPRLPARMAPAAAAALAECCWVVSSMPVENVVVRLQCRPARAPPLHWGASLLELRALYQEGGLRRWWNGSVLGLAASLPQSALWWMVYENSKSFLLPHPPTGEQDLTKQSKHVHPKSAGRGEEPDSGIFRKGASHSSTSCALPPACEGLIPPRPRAQAPALCHLRDLRVHELRGHYAPGKARDLCRSSMRRKVGSVSGTQEKGAENGPRRALGRGTPGLSGVT
ncbi:unnamed protein product [Durusdinium trenchii]|uniref:Uncharacterized protein n=1 Tax=Durusdinium trenchii TaxID=1381693 RepID=A0ABP0LHV2_9DINO